MQLRRALRKDLFVTAFLICPTGLYAAFVLWPYLESFGYSLTDWSGVTPPSGFVGLENYSRLFRDEVFLAALWHNAQLLVVLPVVTIVLALSFAFMLNVGGRRGAAGVRGIFGSAFYRTVFFLPQVFSVAILVIMFQAAYRSDSAGLLNGIAATLGLIDPHSPLPWLASPDAVLWCILAILVWQGVGFYLVLFSAAMQSIPKEIFEAALLDGASRRQTFMRITLPLLWDSVQTAWVYLAIAAMDAFALVASLTPGSSYGGGPDHRSEVLATYLMRNFLTFGNAGYACAMGVVIFVITLALSLFVLRLTRRESVEY
ncbi:sugar ABC transporter permease [Streptomyces sp. NBC_00257]|uniref:carbohydrate ABC transporter permease n=1 Tax=unclassified Streptomyces TaxID=2593676 RepID=UPI0022571A66|nr:MULTISPECIES: sugar ABC transporter permease [unclassified Streptomyces]MCX4398693.1 sugar ABC transporter permease [Streptomyces sp. NBC_01767]MCX4870979.1 sugar ABC transporter permease [Streptomyces sp. NBC_00906]MCX4901718.1 sugar ABC transporter permease [Streptomyces sp. NBC_00892]MCX5426961.1 sugar ABC transporter permease [Streptomyces sp. NBC_00062]WSP50992.1 sugar ABC transporter permease [Streptomyces sp. NBC_01243]